MKINRANVSFAALCALLAAAPIALVLSSARAPGSVAASHSVAAEENLEGSMQLMQGALKRIDKALEKKDLKATLPMVLEMQKAVLEAKTHVPTKAAEMADAKARDEFVLSFRKQMIELQRSLCDLELAVLEDKVDEAKKILETQIKPMKKTGHDKFKGD